MNLISITGSATASRGYSYEDASEMIDLFDAVLAGRATEKAASRMMEIVDSAQPITASARKAMQAVRLPGDKSRGDLAATTARFWKAYAARHPHPAEPKLRSRISTMRQRRAK